MTPAKEQKHYAITQHALCCKYLDVAEPYDGDGDTLFEAVVALRKDRDECKGVTACSPSSTPEVDAITTDRATSSDYKASALGMLARKLTRERDEAARMWSINQDQVAALKAWIMQAAPMLSAASCIVIDESIERLGEIEGVRGILELCPVDFSISENASSPSVGATETKSKP